MANQIDERFILIENNEYLKAKKADGSEGSLAKLNAADKVEFEFAPVVGASELTTEAVVDAKILVEKLRAEAAESALDSRIDLLESLDPMEYKGTFSPATSTPALANGVGSNGDVYRVVDGGSYDFGAGAISLEAGDSVVYSGFSGQWQKWDMTDAVSSVNGKAGAVVLSGEDILAVIPDDPAMTVTGAILNLGSEIDAEISAREAADNALQTAVDSKVSKAGDALTGTLTWDAQVGQFTDHSEISSTVVEMTRLTGLGLFTTRVRAGFVEVEGQGNKVTLSDSFVSVTDSFGAAVMPIDNAHLTPKLYVDNAVAAEAVARDNADVALGLRLDAIEGQSWQKQKVVVSNAATKAYTLAFTPVANTLDVHLGRLFLVEGDDYTVSGAVVTLIGEVATKLKVADTLSFKFLK